MALDSTWPLTEVPETFLLDKGRPERKADNFAAIFEPIV
jgi:hypothetical protein